jgi:GH15 family glucan-1,4-alpha-glucosidase
VRGEDFKTVAEFEIRAGQEIPFALTWSHAYDPHPSSPNVSKKIEDVALSWEKWSKKYKGDGPWAEAVLRSLITLKALTHYRTGGIVAAATTSLPEQIGGPRNWDYRYCWLRDATFTLYALMENGYTDEATLWRDWLLRAVGGSPDKMQIMYSVDGGRRLTEFELPELLGYEGSKPVRIGNAASEQFQLDVWGEVLDSAYQGRKRGLSHEPASWCLQRALVSEVEKLWFQPDDGIWEVRGPRRHFVHSKVMAWVAVDRAIRSVQEFGSEGPLERWIPLRADIHDEICRLGYSHEVNSFVQYFGGKELDASLLLLPIVGFLPADDPRMINTVTAIEKHLMHDGFVMRYTNSSGVDGLPGGEGAFLACSFWLVDNYVLQDRHDEAAALFERLMAVRNDVGLLSEEYDPKERRQLGNFPQAFSHLALVNSVQNMIGEVKPAKHRSGRSHAPK